MKTIFFRFSFFSCLVLLITCRAKFDESIPSPFLDGNGLDVPGSVKLTNQTKTACEGVYKVNDGVDDFGEQVAMKWSYVTKGTDTTYHLTLFCARDAAFIVLEGRQLNNTVIFEGYWRKLVNTQTGTVRFTIAEKTGGQKLLSCCSSIAKGDIVLEGKYGLRTQEPDKKITLTYERPINKEPFAIMAHRCGGRTSDLLPASENTVEIVKLAPELGATGVEMDVRFTKDNIPVIYHDDFLNLRLVQKNGLSGAIEDYTFKQLTAMVRLINGEKIPTLEAALGAVLDNTPLSFVWLDSKYIRNMETVRVIQQKFLQLAASRGRKLDIVLGLPGEDQVTQYEALPERQETPALCELDTGITRRIQARIWAPRWTLGLQTEQADVMRAEGRRVFTWTLDVPSYIEQFVRDGKLDGILTNYAPVVAYYHYTKE